MDTTTADTVVTRTPVNPVAWGQGFLMHQGEVTAGATRTLHCSGQVDLVEDDDAPMGLSVGSPEDMAGQMRAVLGSLDALLDGAGMGRGDISKLTFFTTDIDAFLEHYSVYAEWIGDSGAMPPQSLIGVARLVDPGLLLEVEMTAQA